MSEIKEGGNKNMAERGVIVDTSSWIALSILGLCHYLPMVFGKIYMPEIVKEEVLKGGVGSPGYEELYRWPWIKICPVSKRNCCEFLVDMDEGEADVLRLAYEKGIKTVMLDERVARTCAMKMNIHVTGVLGFLVLIKEKGLIDEVRKYISVLKQRGIWISEDLEKEVLLLAGEEN